MLAKQLADIKLNNSESDDDSLPACKYGYNCIRKNPQHFREYSHPPDFEKQSVDTDTIGNSDDDDSNKQYSCRYGADCYNNSPSHRKRYSHPSEDTSDYTGSPQTVCRYGATCFRTNPEHLRKFSHPKKNANSNVNNIPSYWRVQAFTNDTQRVDIHPKTAQFSILGQLLNETLKKHGSGCGTINGTDPAQFIVTKIQRVLNQNLWEEYCFKKTKIIKKNEHLTSTEGSKHLKQHPFVTPLLDEKANEYWLFHGCARTTLEILLDQGYDPRVGNLGGMFGGGFYLAENSSKANQYIPCPKCGKNSIQSKGACSCSQPENIEYAMIIYRATLGDIHVASKYVEKTYKGEGTNLVRRAPVKDGSKEVYDSVLGESRQHGGDALQYREVILYDLCQAYPEYVIEYKRSTTAFVAPKDGSSVLPKCIELINGRSQRSILWIVAHEFEFNNSGED